MNPDRLGLQEILRYFFSGSIVIIGYAWTTGTIPKISEGADSASNVALLTLLASTSGAILYSSYRAIPYVLVGRLAFWIALLFRWLLSKLNFIKWFFPWTTPSNELERDKWRWKERGNGNGKEGKPRLDEWASQIHLLYASSLGLCVGALIAQHTQQNYAPIPPLLFQVASGGTIIALVSDVRRRGVEESLFEEGLHKNEK